MFVTDSKITADNRKEMGWIVEEVKMMSREQFEAWCINRGISITKSPGYDGYQNPRTKVIWEGWQASRAAIEIDLTNMHLLLCDQNDVVDELIKHGVKARVKK